MAGAERTDILSVNCGGCGKRLKMKLEELLNKRTVDCSECEERLPRG